MPIVMRWNGIEWALVWVLTVAMRASGVNGYPTKSTMCVPSCVPSGSNTADLTRDPPKSRLSVFSFEFGSGACLWDPAVMTSTLAQNLRVRLDLGYDGNHFHGWAAQPGLRTVQDELEKALSVVFREPVVLTVAGRTDAGVHARHQVAHCDVSRAAWDALPGRSSRTPGESLVLRLNSLLARSAGGVVAGAPRGYSDVVVHSALEVPADFDARFSALWRAYTYRIADSVAEWDPQRHDVLWLSDRLDLDAMNRASVALLGEHDFLSYCKPREGASTIRTLLDLGFERVEGIVVGRAKADAFCHSQVRTLMGTLIEVGRGAREERWPLLRLEECSRDGQVVVAPPHPLTLEEIGYPGAAEFGAQARLARRYRG